MIKRITNPEEFKKVIDDIEELFRDHDKEKGHALDLIQNKETIKSSFANKSLLAWDIFVWANDNDGLFDATCIFINDKSVKFGVGIFTEFLWVSKNPKVGFKLLKTAIKYARENKFKYVTLSTSAKNPNSPRYQRFYKKLGFAEDSTSFIAKL